MALFGCDACGKVDDLDRHFLFNDLQVCAECHNRLHDHKKNYAKRTHPVDLRKEEMGEYFDKDGDVIKPKKKGKKK